MIEYQKITAIATSMISFSTFLGVLSAIIYYLYQIRNASIVEAILWGGSVNLTGDKLVYRKL